MSEDVVFGRLEFGPAPWAGKFLFLVFGRDIGDHTVAMVHRAAAGLLDRVLIQLSQAHFTLVVAFIQKLEVDFRNYNWVKEPKAMRTVRHAFDDVEPGFDIINPAGHVDVR